MYHILLSGNNAWGMYNFRKAVLSHFLKKGYQVTVAVLYDEVYFPLLKALGCEVVPLKLDPQSINPWKDLRLTRQYVRLLRQLRPVLSITYTIKPNIYSSIAAQWTKTPHLPITTGLGYAFIHKNVVSHVARRLYRFALRRADKVFFLNESDHNDFLQARLMRPEQGYIIPGEGIDLTEFTPMPYPAPEAPVRFLLIARLLADKGVREYVEAARIIKQKYPAAEFQILGKIWEKNPTAIQATELEQWVKEGLVAYLGESSDVRPSIAQASCIVLPSYREGLPRTLLEGAALARPLIATDVPGCKDLVVNGQNGFLCQSRNVKSLVRACERFLKLTHEEREHMGQIALHLVKEKYAMDKILAHYDDILSTIIDKRV